MYNRVELYNKLIFSFLKQTSKQILEDPELPFLIEADLMAGAAEPEEVVDGVVVDRPLAGPHKEVTVFPQTGRHLIIREENEQFLLSPPPFTHLDMLADKPESAVPGTGPQMDQGAVLPSALHHHHAVTELLDGDGTEAPAVDTFLENKRQFQDERLEDRLT